MQKSIGKWEIRLPHNIVTPKFHLDLHKIKCRNAHCSSDKPREIEYCNQFTSEIASILEALGEQNHFSNELIVWFRHCHRSEQLLQIVRQLLPASVTLSCWVHRYEDTRIGIDVHLQRNKNTKHQGRSKTDQKVCYRKGAKMLHNSRLENAEEGEAIRTHQQDERQMTSDDIDRGGRPAYEFQQEDGPMT